MYLFSDTKTKVIWRVDFLKRKHKGKGVLDIYQIIIFNF